VPLIVMAFWIGLYPKPFFQNLEQSVNHTIAIARPGYPQPGAVESASVPQHMLVAPPAEGSVVSPPHGPVPVVPPANALKKGQQ